MKITEIEVNHSVCSLLNPKASNIPNRMPRAMPETKTLIKRGKDKETIFSRKPKPLEPPLALKTAFKPKTVIVNVPIASMAKAAKFLGGASNAR